MNLWQRIKAALTNKWMSDVTYLAAMAHVGWACLIVLTAYILHPSAAITTALGVMIFAALKEYVYDANFEIPKQTARDNTQDFLGYLGGVLLAALVLYVKRRFLP